MLLPKYLHGLYRDVKKRCTKLVKNATSLDAYAAGMLSMGFVDTAHTEGLLVRYGPSSLVGGEMNFHLYLPLTLLDLKTRADLELRDAIFHESLKTAWGTLLLTSRDCDYWFLEGTRNRYNKYIEA